MIGKTVSHYRVLELLGSGGMGVVYKAEDIRLGRPVALKFLPEHLSKDSQALERLRREARATSSLNHPNICTIHDIDEFEGQSFIVMEFMKGETLKERLARGTLQTDELVELTSQIAGALQSAHAAGILHRDLKPGNIFITDLGQAKILDFGLAKLLTDNKQSNVSMSELPTADQLTVEGSTIGTVAYMSPEQARGEELDQRSDLFSLGTVFYEMVTGQMAFSGNTTAVIFDAILNRPPVSPVRLNPGTPQKLADIIYRLLEKDRDLRYQSAADLTADLKRLKRNTEVSRPAYAPPPSVAASGETSKPVTYRSKKRIVIAISAFVLVSAIALIVLFPHRAPALTERDYILLADFVNTTGDPAFDETLKQALAVQLEQSPYLNVFPDDRIRQALRYMARPANERITDAVAREICQREEIKAVLGGSITAVGSHLVVALNAVNCRSGESLARDQREADSKEHVLSELGKAASSLRGKLGESVASIQKFDTPIERATTSSLEALQAYTEGRRQNQARAFQQAVTFTQRAVELDPNFAVAYTALATYYDNLGQTELARQNASKAFEMRDRVSEREKLDISTRYYDSALGNWNKTIESYQLWTQMYPRDTVARHNLGQAYLLFGRCEDALIQFRERANLRPPSQLDSGNIGLGLACQNRFQEAKTAFQKAVDQKIDGIVVHWFLHGIALMEGDTQAMQKELDWANHKSGEDLMLSFQAEALAGMGKLTAARQYFKQAVEVAQRDERPEIQAGILSLEAGIEALLGNDQMAVGRAQDSLKVTHSPLAYNESLDGAPAIALGIADHKEPVQTWIAEMIRENPQDTLLNEIWIPCANAALELRAGHGARAIELLNAARPYEPGKVSLIAVYLRGLAYLQAKSGRESAAEFQKILDHRGVLPWSVLYSLSELGVARADLLIGDVTNASKSYQTFLNIWKDADPNIPILREAKSEFARVSARN